MKKDLNALFRLIQRYYGELKESLVNCSALEVQYMNRWLLNDTIRSYVDNGGKRDISIYCKYYV